MRSLMWGLLGMALLGGIGCGRRASEGRTYLHFVDPASPYYAGIEGGSEYVHVVGGESRYAGRARGIDMRMFAPVVMAPVRHVHSPAAPAPTPVQPTPPPNGRVEPPTPQPAPALPEGYSYFCPAHPGITPSGRTDCPVCRSPLQVRREED